MWSRVSSLLPSSCTWESPEVLFLQTPWTHMASLQLLGEVTFLNSPKLARELPPWHLEHDCVTYYAINMKWPYRFRAVKVAVSAACQCECANDGHPSKQ